MAIPRTSIGDRDDRMLVLEASNNAERVARGINVAIVDDDVKWGLNANLAELHIARSRLDWNSRLAFWMATLISNKQ